MKFDILTLFPEFFDSPLHSSILGRAMDAGLIRVDLHQIRDWTEDRHRVVDDTPYGGGGGMVMKPEPVVKAVREVRRRLGEPSPDRVPVIYMSPQGQVLNAALVDELSMLDGMILLSGSYEGVDERAIELVVDREISIGDYVLTGGELPALVLINAIARKLEGVLGNASSAPNDSFEKGLLDFPHYTRPEVFEGLHAPEILFSGHHARIQEWRHRQALLRTARRRPDLLGKITLTREDRRWLQEQLALQEPPETPGDGGN